MQLMKKCFVLLALPSVIHNACLFAMIKQTSTNKKLTKVLIYLLYQACTIFIVMVIIVIDINYIKYILKTTFLK